MQYKLTDLMWLMGYFAIGAWMYSLDLKYAIVIFAGAVLGYEIGRRSDHPSFLLSACGAVMGLNVLLAVMIHVHGFTHGKLFLFFSGFDLITIPVWLAAGGIFYWLVTRLKKSPPRLDPARHLRQSD